MMTGGCYRKKDGILYVPKEYGMIIIGK